MGRDKETLLVLRAQVGDRGALDELFRQVQAPLFRCIRHLVDQHELAEEILQEVFIILHKQLMWLREPNVFRTWAYRIAMREAMRTLKRERRRRTVQQDDVLERVAAPSAPGYEQSELIERLPQLVAAVSPASRAVLVLHYWLPFVSNPAQRTPAANGVREQTVLARRARLRGLPVVVDSMSRPYCGRPLCVAVKRP